MVQSKTTSNVHVVELGSAGAQVQIFYLYAISFSLFCRATHQFEGPTRKSWLQLLPRLPLNNHNHHVDYFVTMVHAGYVCVSVIHRTLTWTTGSLIMYVSYVSLSFFFCCCWMCIHTRDPHSKSHLKDFRGV